MMLNKGSFRATFLVSFTISMDIFRNLVFLSFSLSLSQNTIVFKTAKIEKFVFQLYNLFNHYFCCSNNKFDWHLILRLISVLIGKELSFIGTLFSSEKIATSYLMCNELH